MLIRIRNSDTATNLRLDTLEFYRYTAKATPMRRDSAAVLLLQWRRLYSIHGAGQSLWVTNPASVVGILADSVPTRQAGPE